MGLRMNHSNKMKINFYSVWCFKNVYTFMYTYYITKTITKMIVFFIKLILPN